MKLNEQRILKLAGIIKEETHPTTLSESKLFKINKNEADGYGRAFTMALVWANNDKDAVKTFLKNAPFHQKTDPKMVSAEEFTKNSSLDGRDIKVYS